jgi:hypothetical protein
MALTKTDLEEINLLLQAENKKLREENERLTSLHGNSIEQLTQLEEHYNKLRDYVISLSNAAEQEG